MDFFIEIIKAIVQGILQGITEWLPISSTGHILLLDSVWKMQVSDAFFDVFKVVIQFGSILAVLVLYFHKLNPFSSRKSAEEKRGTWILWSKVLVASIPAAVVGLLLDDIIDTKLSVPLVIALALIVYGVAFIVMESVKRTAKVNDLSELSYKNALAIGAFQMLALVPGTSRSGSTILGATLIGTSRTVAAEFSFFMAIPVMLGASALKLAKCFLLDDFCANCQAVLESEQVTADGLCTACNQAVGHVTFSLQEWLLLGIATVVSFVVSVLVIRFLVRFIQKNDFKPFGWYRIALGVVVLLCWACGWL